MKIFYKNYFKTVFTLVIGLALSLNALAQEMIEVTGRVTGDDGFGMPGVSVLVKGKQGRGTATNNDGRYRIKTESNDILIFKYLGMQTVEKKIPGNGTLNVLLKEDVTSTGEVVVTGFQTQKATLTPGSIEKITAESMKDAQVPSIDAGLQGRAAGMQVTQAGGIAGGGVTIRVRGTGSFSGGSEPLWVIDGVPITTGAGGDGGGSFGGGNIGYQTNPIADINPNDIETYEVLKDASATALYGARGSNGVILVTTKRGKAGKTKFSLNFNQGYNNVTNRIDLLNNREYLGVLGNAYYNSALYGRGAANFNLGRDFLDRRDQFVTFPSIASITDSSAKQTNNNWMDRLLQRDARTTDLSVSGSGGNERTTFFIGGSFRDENGIMKGNRFTRFGGRFNLDNTASDKLKIGIGSAITYTINNLVPSGAGSSGQGGFGVAQTRSLPIYPIFFPDSVINLQGSVIRPVNLTPFNPYYNAYGQNAGTNIVLTQDRNYAYYRQQIFRNISNTYLEYKITPALSFRTEGGFDFRSQIDNNYQSRYLRVSDVGVLVPTAAATDSRFTTVNFNNNNILNYFKDIDENNNITALFGSSYQRLSTYSNSVTTENFPNDATTVVSAGSRQLSRSGNETYFALAAYFTKLNYTWNNKYLFQLNARYEGSSRFGANNRWGMFYGVGTGYIISEEDFFKKITWLSLLRIKASYGRTGNQAGLDDFQSFGFYSTGATYTLQPGTRPQRLANPNLTWERADQLDAGIDIGLFKGRVEVTVNYFNKTSRDLLLGLPVSPTAGIGDGTYFRNIGEVRNRGFEYTVNTRNIVTKDFEWRTDFNITFNVNKILDLGGLRPNEVTGSGEFASYVGGQVSTFYLPQWAGIDPQTGQELIYKAERDANGNLTGKLTDQVFRPERVGQLDSNRVPFFHRPIQPKYFGGISNSFKYKGFDLSVLLTFQAGNWILDAGQLRQSYITGTNNLRSDAMEAWKTPGDITNYPLLYYNNAVGVVQPDRNAVAFGSTHTNDPLRFRTTSRFLQDGSFLRVKTVSFGYNLPTEWLKRYKLSTMRVYVNAQNLFTFTRYPGWDPEVVANLQSNQERNLQQGRTDLDFPQIKTITVGFNVGF